MYDCRIVFTVCEILRSHGIDAEDVFPGYIRIRNLDHIIYPFGPSGSFWHHEPSEGKSIGLGIPSGCEDPEIIARAILKHLSAWEEPLGES